jgi:hypothetical protein
MIVSRPFQSERDYERMRALLVENNRLSGRPLYPGIADLDYWRYVYDDAPERVHEAQLWEDGEGRVLGFVWMNAEATDHVSHHEHRGLEREMLAWAERAHLERYPAPGERFHHIYVFDCDPARQALAKAGGYVRTPVFNDFAARDLACPIPRLDPPSGYEIRSLREGDVPGRAALNSLAGGAEVSEAKYRRMMAEAPTYRPDLDLVAAAPNGEIAAFSTFWLDEGSRCGSVEPYGCDPRHRGRSLARNLMFEGMRRLKSRSAERVYTSHGGCVEGEELDAAQRLNASVGFERVGKHELWRKPLAGGA